MTAEIVEILTSKMLWEMCKCTYTCWVFLCAQYSKMFMLWCSLDLVSWWHSWRGMASVPLDSTYWLLHWMFSGLFSAVDSFIMGLKVTTLTSVSPGKFMLGCSRLGNSCIKLEWFAHHLMSVDMYLKFTFYSSFKLVI